MEMLLRSRPRGLGRKGESMASKGFELVTTVLGILVLVLAFGWQPAVGQDPRLPSRKLPRLPSRKLPRRLLVSSRPKSSRRWTSWWPS
jgi:hypothetical protein